MGSMLFHYEGMIGALWKAYLEPADVQKRAWRIVLDSNGDFPNGRTVVMMPYWPAIEKDARLEQPRVLQSVLGGSPHAGIANLLQQCLNSRGSDVKVRELCEYVRKVTDYMLKPKQRRELAEIFKNNSVAMVRQHIMPHSGLADWIVVLAEMAGTDIVPFVLAIMRDTIGKSTVSEWIARIRENTCKNQKDAETALVENVNFIAVVQCEPKNYLCPVQGYSVELTTAEDRRGTPIQQMLAGVIFSTSGFEVTVYGVKAHLTERQFKLLACIAKEIEASLPLKEEDKENLSPSASDKKKIVKIEPLANGYIITVNLVNACLRAPECRDFVDRNNKLKPQNQLSRIFQDADGDKVVNLIFKTTGDRNCAHWVPRP